MTSTANRAQSEEADRRRSRNAPGQPSDRADRAQPQTVDRARLRHADPTQSGADPMQPGADPARSSADPARPQTEVELAVTGMTCASCVARVEKKLNKIPGVTAIVNLATEKAHVEWTDAAGPSDADLVGTVEKAGYGATVLRRITTDDAGERTVQASEAARGAEEAAARAASARVADLRRRFWAALVLSTPIVAVSMAPAWQFPGWQWAVGALSLPVAFWCGWPFLKAAWRAGRHGSTTMDTLVALGILASMGWSAWALLWGGAGRIGYTMAMTGIHGLGHSGTPHLYFESAAFIVTFLLLGRWLESRSRRSAGDALRSLLDLAPTTATRVRREGGDVVEETIDAAELEVGDEFLVRPGETVATDGLVVEGESAVDASLLTGESIPVDVGPGSKLTGGAVNTFGALTVRAVRVGEETTLARMGRLLTEAQTGKAPVQRLADKVSAVFVPAVIAIAAIAFATRLALGNPLEMALASAITVLVVACPCALGLATPTALLVGSGRASRLGILIKGPETLESAHGVQTIVLDKTGTLTTGTMAVSAVRPAEGVGERELLAAAAGVERGSEHPIAKAIVALAHERGIEPKAVESVAARAGNGVEGILDGRRIAAGTARWLAEEGVEGASGLGGEPGASVVGVALEGSLLGAFDIRDAVRPESAAAVAELKSLGLHPVLATGDNEAAASAVAAEVGIDDVRAGILPEGKVGIVEELRAAGQKVAMVGDGVNDAAALAGADLSIAMGSGADVAKEAADITVVSSDIRSVGAAIRISAQTLRIIKENLAWAFGYNVVAIPVAVAGFIVPGIAAAAMASSSVIVVANSLRLRRA